MSGLLRVFFVIALTQEKLHYYLIQKDKGGEIIPCHLYAHCVSKIPNKVHHTIIRNAWVRIVPGNDLSLFILLNNMVLQFFLC